jgi:hypothetical protein
VPAGLSVPEAALVVGIVLVWASLYPVGKLTFSEITPSQLTFARAALTFPVLLGAGMIVGGVTLANINRR